jgi:hypothetical protein
MAAVLSYGPEAVVSHGCAAARWELRPSSSPVIDVTVPGHCGRPRGRSRRPNGRRLFDLRAVEDVCARQGGRGVRSVRQVLADFTAPPPTRSDFERDFLYLCRDAGLPPPAVNAELAGYEVDCVWRGERLSDELDSRTFHERRSAFEAGRLRDAAVQLAGYRAIRVTHRRFYEEPGEVARTLRKLVS